MKKKKVNEQFENIVIDDISKITIDEALVQYEPMVHRFVNTAHTNHVCSKEDLCQEGRMAIIVAYNNFDPSKGASLTTWTYHMIKDAIIEYQKHHLSILSGGSYLQGILRKAGQDATVEEIMEFGVSKKTALAAHYYRDSFTSVDFDELSTFIADGGINEESLEYFDWKQHLTPDEAYAIGCYYGFEGPAMSMREIGEKLGRSRKSVSYMINKAIRKLKHVPGIEVYAFN